MLYSDILAKIFPYKDGIHDIMSPRTILTGLCIDLIKHCKLEFGTYVHIPEEHDNSLLSRNASTIALRPTAHTQGSHYFLNINSGYHAHTSTGSSAHAH